MADTRRNRARWWAQAVAACVLAAPAQGEQVCTLSTLGDKDFNGISGSSDADVVAVGKDGNIARYDGVSWTAEASPTTEELNDVEVVSSALAYAVGKKGTVLHYDGAGWTARATPDDKELQGVWGDSPSAAWAAGKNGTLISWNGTAWVDVGAAAGTGDREMVDLWGHASEVWALDSDGVLYRFDRITGAWDSPDGACDVGGGNFVDLWGDGSGTLYLVKKELVYRYDGITCSTVATASKDLLGVYGNGSRVIAVGKDGRVLEYDGAVWVETVEAADDLRDVWMSAAGNAYYSGKKGQLTACTCVDCAIPGFVVRHDGYGIHCIDEPVTVDVVDIVGGGPYPDLTATMVLDTQSGSGSWSLLSGGGALSDATPGDGLATYTWPGGEATATFALSYRAGAPSLDVDAYDAADPATRDDDSEGLLAFTPSGFTVTAAAVPNPPPATLAPFAGPVTAGSDFALHIAAFGQTPTDPVCGIIESYDGPRDLAFWFAYDDPATGTRAPTIDAIAAAPGEGAAGLQPVAFVDGQAVVTTRYKDAGRISIYLKDPAAHADLPDGIRGATAPFVSLPARFQLSAIAAAGTPNPGAADADGAVFVAAGDPFSVTVTALDAAGDPTPNYGRESTPETVTLTTTLVAPAGGANPPLDAGAGFGPFAAGQATGTSFSWPEVGIVRLVPAVGDGDYLGAGNVLGTASGNVGRFIPHHFATAVNAPVLATACAAGGFSYVGEAFGYSVAPVIAVTAESAGATTTANYGGAFWKLDNASLGARTYSSAAGALDLSGLPPASADPVIVDAGGGSGTLTFSAGSGLVFQRLTPVAPFEADISLSVNVRDADAVAATPDPVSFGVPGGMAFDAGRTMRYGRVVVASALGSERIDLPVPVEAQYFVDPATGFVRNPDEACNAAITLSLTDYAGNLDAGETCARDSGAPGQSGAGCAAPAPAAVAWREPATAGDYNLHLAAPGPGNDGSVTVTAEVPAWLRYDWDGASAGDENPAGRVTFGIFRGDDATVYTREIY